MTKTLKTLLIILGVVVIGGFGVLAFQNLTITEKPIIGEQVIDELEEESELDEISSWKTYRNERYNFEIRYPENYRIAKLIMEEELKSAISLKEYRIEKFGISEEEKGGSPSLEDWIVITDMTIKEEQDYLKGDYDGHSGGYGPITAPGNFPAGTILISPDTDLSTTDQIEEKINKGGGVWDEDGFKWFDFQIKETDSGIKVRKWKFVGRHALVNASIALPEKVLSPYPVFEGSSDYIEKMKYFDQIRFWTPSWGYNEELFNEIIFTFKFLD